MGEGARRCAHPSRLSTWQLQFASPSLTLHLPGARCGAEPRPTRGRGSPVGASGSPTQTPARGWGPQGPLSRSSDTQEGAHSPSSLWSWWAGLGEGAKPPKAVTPSPTDRKGRSTSLERVSLSRKGDAGALPHTLREGMRSGPQAPRPLGRCCVGGGGRGGDSAALRLPPRNFAAAGATVATGTESFCSPMSGLPGQEGGWEAATPRWDPGPAALSRGLPAQRKPTVSSPLPLTRLSLSQSHQNQVFQTLGALR